MAAPAPAAAAAPPIIQIVDLHKSFGDHQVLTGINVEVPPGSTLVILGGSGSGKTVLMKHMIGLLKPDSGQVIVDGEDIVPFGPEALERVRRKFGMVFQAAALFDSMNVYENVSFPLREHRKELSEEEMRALVKEKLSIVGLKDVEHKFPADLSGGMRKRAGLARALALEPAILLADEPSTGLDPVTSGEIDRLLVALRDRTGATLIVVTHNIPSARVIGDELVFLDEGRIVAQGTAGMLDESDIPLVRRFMQAEGAG